MVLGQLPVSFNGSQDIQLCLHNRTLCVGCALELASEIGGPVRGEVPQIRQPLRVIHTCPCNVAGVVRPTYFPERCRELTVKTQMALQLFSLSGSILSTRSISCPSGAGMMVMTL